MDLKEGLEELHQIQQMKKRVEKYLSTAPKGSMWVQESRHHPQYYLWLHDNKKTEGKKIYLRKENSKLVQQLAQKEYYQKLYRELEALESILSSFFAGYELHNLYRVYDSLSPHKQKLVTPYPVLDDTFIENWKRKILSNPARISYPVDTAYKTKNGELVRSKSEMIFADRLCDLHIPYLYEAPLLLKNGKTTYPDFTILHLRRRRTIYFELFGMMDNPEYSNRAMEKIRTYHQNGIDHGENFFFLMETQRFGMDVTQMDRLIHQYFL